MGLEGSATPRAKSTLCGRQAVIAAPSAPPLGSCRLTGENFQSTGDSSRSILPRFTSSRIHKRVRVFGPESGLVSRLFFLFYCPIAPLLLMLYMPKNDDVANMLTLVAMVSGLAVGRIHLKQSNWRARLAVFVGYLVAAGLGTFLWLMGLLAISFLFASVSGSRATMVGHLMLGFTVLMLLLAPPLGAWIGSRTVASKSA